MVLSLESQSGGLELGQMAVAGSAVGSVVGRPVTGLCLVPGWMGLALGPWSIRLALGQGSTLWPLVGSSDSRLGVWISVAPVESLGGL